MKNTLKPKVPALNRVPKAFLEEQKENGLAGLVEPTEEERGNLQEWAAIRKTVRRTVHRTIRKTVSRTVHRTIHGTVHRTLHKATTGSTKKAGNQSAPR